MIFLYINIIYTFWWGFSSFRECVRSLCVRNLSIFSPGHGSKHRADKSQYNQCFSMDSAKPLNLFSYLIAKLTIECNIYFTRPLSEYTTNTVERTFRAWPNAPPVNNKLFTPIHLLRLTTREYESQLKWSGFGRVQFGIEMRGGT